MKKYIKPNLKVTDIEIEDVCAPSGFNGGQVDEKNADFNLDFGDFWN